MIRLFEQADNILPCAFEKQNSDMMETPTPPSRITMRSIFEGILDTFNLERGLIYTSIALTTKPGIAIRTYLYEDRTKLVKPFRFLVLTIAVATFVTVQYFKYSSAGEEFALGFSEGFGKGAGGDTAGDAAADMELRAEAFAKQVGDITQNYFNLFLLAGVPVIALATMWVFRRKMNYAEHLVVNSYITGYMTLVYLLMMPLLFFMNFLALSKLYMVFLLGYSAWSYTRIFGEKLWAGIGKSLLAMLIYIVLYYVGIMLVVLVWLFAF